MSTEICGGNKKLSTGTIKTAFGKYQKKEDTGTPLVKHFRDHGIRNLKMIGLEKKIFVGPHGKGRRGRDYGFLPLVRWNLKG